MDRRTHETPMDFEYDNRNAQIPLNSPWRGGTHRFGNSFSNPIMPSNYASSTSTLRGNLPQTPIKNHVDKFRENPSLDFSSGAEDASSPENGDTEDTPEVPKGIKPLNDKVTIARGTASPTKPKPSTRRSIGEFFSFHAGLTPEQKQLSRRADLTRKPHKRKRREFESDAQLIRRRSSSDLSSSDLDDDRAHTYGSSTYGARTLSDLPAQIKEMGTLPAILSFMHNHPHLPGILTQYGMTMYRWFLLLAVMFLLCAFVLMVRHDVDMKFREALAEVVGENSACAEKFLLHGCADRAKLGPAFKPICDEWELCMTRDARAISRSKISAYTVGEIANGFIEPLSYKFMFFILAIVLVLVLGPNLLFGSSTKPAQAQPQTSGFGFPPSTPHASFASQHSAFDPPPYTPSRGRTYEAPDFSYYTASGSPTKRMEGQRSPQKRIGSH